LFLFDEDSFVPIFSSFALLLMEFDGLFLHDPVPSDSLLLLFYL